MNRDASHRTGEVLCTKGKETLVLIARPDRLRYPMTRTNPKGAVHPGWRRISSDEALDIPGEDHVRTLWPFNWVDAHGGLHDNDGDTQRQKPAFPAGRLSGLGTTSRAHLVARNIESADPQMRSRPRPLDLAVTDCTVTGKVKDPVRRPPGPLQR
jgi:anaerobic selenocysteine-containing dehydrogenase